MSSCETADQARRAASPSPAAFPGAREVASNELRAHSALDLRFRPSRTGAPPLTWMNLLIRR
jgi:hypothetical protein